MYLSCNIRKCNFGGASWEPLDQPAYSCSLIRIFTGHILNSQRWKVSSCEQWRLIRLFFDVQADLSFHWAHMLGGMFSHIMSHFLGPVVQSVVSLTSSLRVNLLTVLPDSIHYILIFFAEKMWVAFAVQKLPAFFQQKIFSIFEYHSM